MEEFVSTRWIRLAGLAASTSVVWTLFIPIGFPWMGLVWVGLALSGALWLRKIQDGPFAPRDGRLFLGALGAGSLSDSPSRES